jgi:hypothetical protein
MKKLTMAIIVASLMAVAALATLMLAGGAAATVRSGKLIEIPFGSYAHASGTDLYCKNTNSGNGVHLFDCYVAKQTGSHLYIAGNKYQAAITDLGVEVDKSNAASTGFSFSKGYSNG